MFPTHDLSPWNVGLSRFSDLDWNKQSEKPNVERQLALLFREIDTNGDLTAGNPVRSTVNLWTLADVVLPCRSSTQPLCIQQTFWVNYNELTTSSLEIIVSKGNHPHMALIQVSELL